MGNRSKFQNTMKISAVLLSACAFSAFAAPSIPRIRECVLVEMI